MRKLIHIPMIHTREAMAGQADYMGQTAASVNDLLIDNFAPQVKTYWDIIRDGLSRQNPQRGRFFVEGSDIHRYVEPGSEIPQAFRNTLPPDFEVINDFIGRVGGIVERTEDLRYLYEMFERVRSLGAVWSTLQEGYNFLSTGLPEEEAAKFSQINVQLTKDEEIMLEQFLEARGSSIGAVFGALNETETALGELTLKRDQYIADQIVTTLQEGETGYLFLGIDHDVQRFLPADIKTEVLDERLNDIIDEFRQVSDEDQEKIYKRITFEGGNGTRI